MNAASAEYGTLVMHDNGTFVRGGGSDGGGVGGGGDFESMGGGGMNTVVQHGGGGPDYIQAVRSAMQENDGCASAASRSVWMQRCKQGRRHIDGKLSQVSTVKGYHKSCNYLSVYDLQYQRLLTRSQFQGS